MTYLFTQTAIDNIVFTFLVAKGTVLAEGIVTCYSSWANGNYNGQETRRGFGIHVTYSASAIKVTRRRTPFNAGSVSSITVGHLVHRTGSTK